MEGGFLAVLHTWGRALNWHPHLHVLVSAGGRAIAVGRWRQARDNYLFPVWPMSKVFRRDPAAAHRGARSVADVRWPERLDTLEARRDWRLKLAGRNWNIFSRATLGNTRAVVRYLARYTSRIAISNQRIKRIDEENQTVTFKWKDYREGDQTRETTLSGAAFIRRFTRHLVPQGFRRIRQYGLLCGRRGRIAELPGAPTENVAENHVKPASACCKRCGHDQWRFHVMYLTRSACMEALDYARGLAVKGLESFSLPPAASTG